MLADNPFKELSFFNVDWDGPYLGLLCTLAQDHTWQLQLYQNGHLDNCLAIAQTLLSHNPLSSNYYALVTHIFSLIDALGDETQPFYNTVQTHPRWQLVLHAWHFIFNRDYIHKLIQVGWRANLDAGYLNSLPSLVVYARKESNGNDEPLFALVEEVCCKIEERKQHEQGDAQQAHHLSLWFKEFLGLCNLIWALLDASLRDCKCVKHLLSHHAPTGAWYFIHTSISSIICSSIY